MLKALNTYTKDLLHLFFPQLCEGCGSDVLSEDQLLCLQCSSKLPETGFFSFAENPVEKTFYGRLKLEAAGAAYYFTKGSLIQHLITQLKYRNNKKTGEYLGRLTGAFLLKSNRFDSVDYIIPLPLNIKKLQKRGYNQAAVISEGISTTFKRPILLNAVEREQFTETQTKKDRVDRWQNMKDVFSVTNEKELINKHILLVDDIVTTGATLEACGTKLLKIPGLKLSIAAVCWTI